MPILHMDMPPCHYIDYPEGPVHPVSPGYHSVSPGYHSVSAEDLQHEQWIDTSYLRGRHPMGNLRHADTFEYRWEAPTPFRRYRSVTPPNHAISAYGPEASSPMEAYLSAPMELHSHHNLQNGWHASPVSSTGSVERIRSLISVYGQQTRLQKQTCQSAKLGKHPQFGISLHGSEAHPTGVSPSDSTEQPPSPGISACGREASPCFRMHLPTTVENLLHCRISACGPEAPLPLHRAPTSSSRSTVASQVCMISKESYLFAWPHVFIVFLKKMICVYLVGGLFDRLRKRCKYQYSMLKLSLAQLVKELNTFAVPAGRAF